MNKLRHYILANLSSVFSSIFLPLFAIASMIFSIKLASYTAIIKLTVLDMVKLYLFVLPDILFYTLPISFFIAAVLSIFKLSNDNEIVVLFSLGIRPSFLLKTLFVPASLLSLLLLINFYILYPHTDNLSDNFIDRKKSEAKFNLSASEFGNKFGDWLMYISKENKAKKIYEDIFLFNRKNKEEVLIAAKKARIINEQGVLQLKLYKGEGYSYSKEKFTQIDFETMTIYDSVKTWQKKYETPYEFWTSPFGKKKKERLLVSNTLMALFPLASLFLALSIGIVHTRHQKSHIYLYIFLGVIVYFGLSMTLHKLLHFYAIPIILTGWLIATYLLYRRNIAQRF